MIFYLGTHKPIWLERTDRRLFVSRVQLQGRKTYPRALGPWALDSGAFTELDHPPHTWTLTAAAYVALVRRFADEIGQMEWAAPQDWMCEPSILAKTGLPLGEHLRRTVRGYLEARDLAPDLPIIPVLQGWVLDDYLRCADLYHAAGVDLAALPLVGLGTVCRRQGTREAEQIVRRLAAEGFRLHGFGVKLTGLERFWDALASADSMAWSFGARKKMQGGQPSCDPSRRKSCANCLHYAVEWCDSRVLPLTDPEVKPLWKETPCVV